MTIMSRGRITATTSYTAIVATISAKVAPVSIPPVDVKTLEVRPTSTGRWALSPANPTGLNSHAEPGAGQFETVRVAHQAAYKR